MRTLAVFGSCSAAVLLWAGALPCASGDIFAARYASSPAEALIRYADDGSVVWANSSDMAGVYARGLALRPGTTELLVANVRAPYSNYGNIKRFSAVDGTYLGDFFPETTPVPYGLAIQGGYVYMSDTGANDVKRYDLTTGVRDSGFSVAVSGVRDIEFGPDGKLYAASYNDNAVYAVDVGAQTKTLFATNGQPIQLTWNGDQLYVDSGAFYPNRVDRYDASGNDLGTFLDYHIYTSIAGMDFGPSNTFLVLDYNNGYLRQYTDNGTSAVNEHTLVTVGQYGAPDAILYSSTIPEAGTVSLLMIGLAALVRFRRRG